MKPPPKPSITEVFEHYGATVVGVDTGGWQKATCALLTHDDRSPSASVNESDCKWHCWACGESGDAIDLVQANEGVSFREAVDIIRERFGDGDSGVVKRATSKRPGRREWTPPWTRV